MPNGDTPYMTASCGFNPFDGWQGLFFATESMRREFSFSLQSLASQIENNRHSADFQFASLETQAEKIGAATNLATEKIGAALALQASQNHASLAAQIAECCCEVKEKIASDGQQTRDLINSIESDRLRTENQQLQARLLALEVQRGHGNGG